MEVGFDSVVAEFCFLFEIFYRENNGFVVFILSLVILKRFGYLRFSGEDR